MLLENPAHDHGLFHPISSVILVFDAIVKGARWSRSVVGLVVGKTQKINPSKWNGRETRGGQDGCNGHVVILCKSPAQPLGRNKRARNIDTHEDSGSRGELNPRGMDNQLSRIQPLAGSRLQTDQELLEIPDGGEVGPDNVGILSPREGKGQSI
jgi:hypothetical protein